MFSLRNTIRATRAIRPAAPNFTSAVRPLSISARLGDKHPDTPETPATNDHNKREVISEKQVPVADYINNSSKRTVIPVRDDPEIKASVEEQERKITPLTREMYDKLPKALQKATVMDKVVVITGGARGLGNSMAEALAEAGAKAVVIFDANQELGDQSAAELHEKTGVPVQFYKVDVRDGGAIIEAVNAVVEQFGAPDVLINAAGIADSNIKAEDYDHAMFRRLIDINLNGSFLVAQAAGRAMMAAKKPGSIIFIASMSGFVVNYPQEQSCYNASKAGVIHLGRSLATEWAKYGIRVNSICPGYMDTALNRVPALEAQKKIWTSLTPQNRLGSVDDLNGLALYLASDSSAFTTGSAILSDGGYSCW